MDTHLGASEALDAEKALRLAALAAVAWCARGTSGAVDGATLVARLMRASAWVSRVRAHRRLDAMPMSELVDAFGRPSSEWLPGAGHFALVEDGEPTPLCSDLVEDAGASAVAEVEQRIILKAMDYLGVRPEAARAYATFRRFLVEHAYAPTTDAARAARSVGLDLPELYRAIPATASESRASGDVFYPCPRCRWPMTIRATVLACARSPSCLAEGARFGRDGEKLVPLGPLPLPEAVPCQGHASIHPGVWRYTVLPGIEELHLEKQLNRIEGVTVELWPFVDMYDLDVRLGERRWRVDVKDHASPTSLARHLADRPAPEQKWIVVPDARRHQVEFLREYVPRTAGYAFAHSSEFVRRVKKEAE